MWAWELWWRRGCQVSQAFHHLTTNSTGQRDERLSTYCGELLNLALGYESERTGRFFCFGSRIRIYVYQPLGTIAIRPFWCSLISVEPFRLRLERGDLHDLAKVEPHVDG